MNRYLAVALSRRLGCLLTPADLGLAVPGAEEDDSIGLFLGADPLDVLLPMWRFELERRRFLTTSAYSVAAAALPLSYVREIADRTAAARTGHTVGLAEVAAVRDMVRVFSEMDERHGGRPGICESRRVKLPPATRPVPILVTGQVRPFRRHPIGRQCLQSEQGLCEVGINVSA
jgi:hypothetical protein